MTTTNMPPPGYPPGYPQQPGYPAPQTQVLPPGYPVPPGAQQVYQGAPQGYPQQIPQGQYMPGPPAAPPAPATPLPTVASLPSFAGVDAAMAAQVYAAAEEEKRRAQEAAAKRGIGFWNGPKPPNGIKEWAEAPKGAKSKEYVWLCPTATPGIPPFKLVETHFRKGGSAGKGLSIVCLGAERCPICLARNGLFTTGSEADSKRAMEIRKARKQAYWWVITLDDPREMFDEKTGKMAPLLWRAPYSAHEGILECFKQVEDEFRKHKDANLPVGAGMGMCLNWYGGRPFLVTKEKNGPQEMNVEWTVRHSDACDLPQQFWPVVYNLRDFDAVSDLSPTQENIRAALTDMNLPWFPTVVAAWQALPQEAQQQAAQPAAAPVQQPMPPAAAYPQQQPAYPQAPQQPAGYPPGYPPQQPQGYPPGYSQQPTHPQNAPLPQLQGQLAGQGR